MSHFVTFRVAIEVFEMRLKILE